MGNTLSAIYKWMQPPNLKWRTDLDWTQTNREHLISYVNNYKPPFNLPTTNILLVGVAGAGKSSFINTVVSAVKREVICCAAVRGNKSSVTKHIRRYRNILKNVHLCDTIGVPVSHEQMSEVEKLMLKGKMPSGSDEKHTKDLVEDIHAGLIVVDPDNLQNNIDMIKNNIGKVQDMFEEREIPYMMLITKIDQINECYQDSTTNIVYDQEIKRLVDLAFVAFGVPRNRIWPIVNYEADFITHCDIDILALSVLKMVLHFGEAYAEVLLNSPDERE